MKRRVMLAAVLGLLAGATGAGAGWNPLAENRAEEQAIADAEVAAALAAFKNSDPSMQVFFDKAYGYAIFPDVKKGGIGIGGAFGEGEVYEQGKLIGRSTMKQVTVGFQLGGQAFREIIFFKDKAALDHFTSGNFEFGAQISAVAATSGASAASDYSDGVAVFTLTKKGLMYEATVGGQRFKFKRK